MFRTRLVTLAFAIALIAGLVAVGAGGASAAESPKATEIGVTPTEIHIAVVADVDSPLAPNVFKGSVDGVRAWAKYANAHGGIGGRRVVVDFYDSKLNPNETRNAIINACQNDLAMVGTSAVFLSNIEDMTGCKDSTGAVTGIPDLPFTSLTVNQQCSPQSFGIAPANLICSTKDQHPQTYQASVGRGYYYQEKFGKDLHGPYIFSAEAKSAHDSQFVSGLGQVRAIGIKSDQDFSLKGAALQSEYTQVALAMKTDGSNYAQSANPYQAMIALRKEAALQGVTGVKVWDCTGSCYDPGFLSAGGSDVEGTYVFLGGLPDNETKSNAMLADYVKAMGSTPLSGFSKSTFAAGLLFQQAANAVVEKAGVNGLTRKAIFDEMNKIHSFNAGGMIGTIDPAGRVASPCFMLLQVQKGKYVRVYPKKAGTFDCKKRNLIHVKLDMTG